MSKVLNGAEAEDLFNEKLVFALSNEVFRLILLPTEQCNFRCTYCYEDFSIGRMSAATIQGVKRLIDRRVGDLRLLHISWFGGEPLIAWSVIEEISSHIVQVVAERKGLYYVGDMTTNGYLLDSSAVQRLVELGICFYQISLDGPEFLHDRTRVRINGKGSFHQIWQNLLAIRNSRMRVDVALRIHLTPENLAYMPAFLAEVRDTFLHDARFKVLLKPIEKMGGPNDATMKIITEEERSQIIAELESVVLEGGDTSRLFATPDVCYAAQANSLLIRANGLIGKCTVALSDPCNTIGQLRPDGTLHVDNELFYPWLHGWESRDRAAIQCPYAKLRHNQPQPQTVRWTNMAKTSVT